MINKIYKVSASWCGPCRQLKKELTDFDLVPIEEIDAEDNDEFCQDYKIRNIPTLIFLNENNQEVERYVGFITKSDLIAKINELNKE